jgi:hypothetical protein
VIALQTTADGTTADGADRCAFGFPRNDNPNVKWELYREMRSSLTRKGTGEHVAFGSDREVVSARQAIDAFTQNRKDFVVDCQIGLEFSVLAAVREALDAEFDKLHRPTASDPHALSGLGIPLIDSTITDETFNVSGLNDRIGLNGLFGQKQGGEPVFSAQIKVNSDTAFGKHMVPLIVLPLNPCKPYGGGVARIRGINLPQREILAEDLVPGDYAYLSNPPDYEVWHPGGPSSGENAVFATMRLQVDGNGKPVHTDKHGNPVRDGFFVVHGFHPGLISEPALKDKAMEAYNENWKPSTTMPCKQAQDIELTWQKIEKDDKKDDKKNHEKDLIRWTLLAGPTRDGNMREAGPYVQ